MSWCKQTEVIFPCLIRYDAFNIVVYLNFISPFHITMDSSSSTSRLQQIIVILSCLSWYISPGNAYCWQIGWNPSFKGAPKVVQVDTTVVQVSWGHIIETRECADQFVVKYWKSRRPNDYTMTDLISVDLNSVLVTGIEPGVKYTFQVIAREDKPLSRIEYNYSPTTSFLGKYVPKKEKKIISSNAVIAESHSLGEKYDIESRILQPKSRKSVLTPTNSKKVVTEVDQTIEQSQKNDHSGTKEAPRFSITVVVVLIVGGVMVVLLVVGIGYNCIRKLKETKPSCPKTMLKTSRNAENVYTEAPDDNQDKCDTGVDNSLSESEPHKYSSSDTIKASSLNDGI